MSEFSVFFDMGGYGFFIWSAYLVWLFLLILLIFNVILRKKFIEKKLKYLNLEKYGVHK